MIQILVFSQCVFLQVLHVLVDVYQILFNVLLDLVAEHVHGLCEFLVVFSDHFLIFFELLLDVRKEIPEQLLVVEDKFVDDGLVQVSTGELIGVAFIDD